MGFRLTPAAAQQLEAQLRYVLDHHGPISAERVHANLQEACESLTMFPERGTTFDETRRVLVVGNHLVYYRVEADGWILVLHIDHAKQQRRS